MEGTRDLGDEAGAVGRRERNPPDGSVVADRQHGRVSNFRPSVPPALCNSSTAKGPAKRSFKDRPVHGRPRSLDPNGGDGGGGVRHVVHAGIAADGRRDMSRAGDLETGTQRLAHQRACSSLAPKTRTVCDFFGMGVVFNVASVMMAKTPKDPAMSGKVDSVTVEQPDRRLVDRPTADLLGEAQNMMAILLRFGPRGGEIAGDDPPSVPAALRGGFFSSSTGDLCPYRSGHQSDSLAKTDPGDQQGRRILGGQKEDREPVYLDPFQVRGVGRGFGVDHAASGRGRSRTVDAERRFAIQRAQWTASKICSAIPAPGSLSFWGVVV